VLDFFIFCIAGAVLSAISGYSLRTYSLFAIAVKLASLAGGLR